MSPERAEGVLRITDETDPRAYDCMAGVRRTLMIARVILGLAVGAGVGLPSLSRYFIFPESPLGPSAPGLKQSAPPKNPSPARHPEEGKTAQV